MRKKNLSFLLLALMLLVMTSTSIATTSPVIAKDFSLNTVITKENVDKILKYYGLDSDTINEISIIGSSYFS